jgi:aldehyde dehydrogenase (NAD+)
MSIRQPIGVAGIITPWNFPMAIPCWKMMPALVTGNTVVLKPATDTPHCAVLAVELMEEAGLPAGTVNLVTGSGPDVGMPLVESPDVPVISFTGSNQTGRRIAEAAARRLKRVSLELGGKNGIVVMSDADLDLAVDGILWSAFGTTGQRCTACSRVIVAEEVADRLVDELAERAAGLRLGAGSDPATDVGPLINGAALERVAGARPRPIARGLNTATSSRRQWSTGCSRWTGWARRRSSGRCSRSSAWLATKRP